MEAQEQHHEADASHAPVEVLPLNRIKRLMKEETDVKAVSAEASYAAARATELLIEEMALRAFQVTHAKQRDTVSYGDVAASVAQWAPAQFLRDIVPPRVALSEIIKRLHTEELQAQQQQQQEAVEQQEQKPPVQLQQAAEQASVQVKPEAMQPPQQVPVQAPAAVQGAGVEGATEAPAPMANGGGVAAVPHQNGSPMQVDFQQPAVHAVPSGMQQAHQPQL